MYTVGACDTVRTDGAQRKVKHGPHGSLIVCRRVYKGR